MNSSGSFELNNHADNLPRIRIWDNPPEEEK
jgi:hypothetical protein